MTGDESWRTLLQCFRTKLFLATSDEFTARIAAELCGRVDRLKARYTLGEAGEGAHISLLTGRAAAAKHTVTATKTYSWEADYLFPPRVFTELQNAQAVVLPYDGLNPSAAAILLPETVLPRCADQLLRSRRRRSAMSSLDRILPFLRPIEDLLVDPAITEVMVNEGGRCIFVEREGGVEAVAWPDARIPQSHGGHQEHRAGAAGMRFPRRSPCSTHASKTARASRRCSPVRGRPDRS